MHSQMTHHERDEIREKYRGITALGPIYRSTKTARRICTSRSYARRSVRLVKLEPGKRRHPEWT